MGVQDVSTPEKGFFAEEVISLEEFMKRNPCKHCGHHYNDHWNLSQAEIADAEEQGCVVSLCTTRRRWTFTDHKGPPVEEEVKWCLVIRPLSDPCDEDFMKEIST
jgi:transposase